MDRHTGDAVMNIHTGGWLGESVSPFYVCMVGLALLATLVSGASYLFRRGGGGAVRKWHRVLGAVFLLPLFVTASTGLLSEASDTWLHFPESFGKLMMTLHEGRGSAKEARCTTCSSPEALSSAWASSV